MLATTEPLLQRALSGVSPTDEESLSLAGETDLGTIALLLRDSRLLLCNDTGVSHIAAALKVPSVVIFTGSDPDRWKPLDVGRHVAVMGRERDAQRAAIDAAQRLLSASAGRGPVLAAPLNVPAPASRLAGGQHA